MLTKSEKSLYRQDLFQHLDGIATAPSAFVLQKHGVLDFIIEKKEIEISEISTHFNANEGYLNVALRILASQGWLKMSSNNQDNSVYYSINESSVVAFKYVSNYEGIVRLLKLSEKYHSRIFDKEPFNVLESLFEKYRNGFSFAKPATQLEEKIQGQILKHIEGCLIAPSIVALGMSGMFHQYFMEASFRPDEFHKDPDSFGSMLEFFRYLGWYVLNNQTYSFTDKGLFFARRASAYGVTVSYNPTFRSLDELIFGDPNILRNLPAGSPEKHVDRKMNVWGSGGAHGTYFKKIDEIIISIFNKPIDQQPKGIVDMGCGNGAYIKHLYEVIEQRTLRGTMLEDYPLFLVGADYNEAALKMTRTNLINADIWAKVIWGDIGRPDLLAKDLKDNYRIELEDLLNVRTFLDHNRIWAFPIDPVVGRVSKSEGAFASKGIRLSNNLVEDNLLEHFRKWAPYVKKFGLLIIELHTISTELVANNLGKTAATAYDATHGYSDQYILEIEQFNNIASEAGLYSVPEYFSKFPNNDIATVSIHLFKGL